MPSAQHNAYRKEGRCQRSTAESFDSQNTQPQLHNSPKRLFSHNNKEQLQSDIDRSTNKVTKQDVSQKTAFVGMLCVHAQNLPTYPFSSHNSNQRSSSERTQQAKNERLRTAGLLRSLQAVQRGPRWTKRETRLPQN